MKAIIFDFDGVIHDTFETVYKTAVKVFGKDLTRENYRNFFDGNIYEREEIKKEVDKKFFKLQRKAFECLKIEENIKNNLEKLFKKYPLFIVSSNQEETLDVYFRNNKFDHIFKKILGVETHKSKVEKFKYLFEKYNLKAKDCVFVTDTLGDILEGHKVGLRTIAVDFGFHRRERLEKGKPLKIVSSFDEILEAIEDIK
jgi:HAD superfamily hydrolase (TIGR01509 family)